MRYTVSAADKRRVQHLLRSHQLQEQIEYEKRSKVPQLPLLDVLEWAKPGRASQMQMKPSQRMH